jgi:sulfur-oxidizing protein SoxX
VIWLANTIRSICCASLICLSVLEAFADEIDDGSLARGKELVMARDRGNCLACHAIDDGKLPGNLGPPLFSMRLRFPDEELLRNQIWDATERNPDSRMPPFGKHGILDEEEIDHIVEYLYSL